MCCHRSSTGLRNLPHGFDIYLVNIKTKRNIAQPCTATMTSHLPPSNCLPLRARIQSSFHMSKALAKILGFTEFHTIEFFAIAYKSFNLSGR